MLLIEIPKIPPEGLELDTAFSADEVHLEAEHGLSLQAAGHLAGRIDIEQGIEHGNGNALHVRGHLQARLGLECGRCLEPFGLPVEQELDLFYLPHRPGAAEGEEVQEDVALSDRDMVVAYYRGERLDLGEVLREQLFLAVPMKRLCQPACKGLCPSCGINLNGTACDCAPEKGTDPRLLPLARLLDKGTS